MPDLHSLGVLLALIVLSVGGTTVILYLIRFIREKQSRRKYR